MNREGRRRRGGRLRGKKGRDGKGGESLRGTIEVREVRGKGKKWGLGGNCEGNRGLTGMPSKVI